MRNVGTCASMTGDRLNQMIHGILDSCNVILWPIKSDGSELVLQHKNNYVYCVTDLCGVRGSRSIFTNKNVS